MIAPIQSSSTTLYKVTWEASWAPSVITLSLKTRRMLCMPTTIAQMTSMLSDRIYWSTWPVTSSSRSTRFATRKSNSIGWWLLWHSGNSRRLTLLSKTGQRPTLNLSREPLGAPTTGDATRLMPTTMTSVSRPSALWMQRSFSISSLQTEVERLGPSGCSPVCAILTTVCAVPTCASSLELAVQQKTTSNQLCYLTT